MVITNGELVKVEVSGGGFVDGVPQAEERTLSEAIPCNISGSRHRDNRSDETPYTSAEYDVLIDNNSDFDAQEVVLYKRGRLGTFRVQDIQYLDYADAIKLKCTRHAD